MGASQQLQEFQCCEFSFNEDSYSAENKELVKKDLMRLIYEERVRTDFKTASSIFMFKPGLKQVRVKQYQQLQSEESTNFTTNNNQQLSPRTEHNNKTLVDAQILILDYLGRTKEEIILIWQLLCRSAHSFVSQHSDRMFLQTEHNNLSLHQIRSFEEHQSGVNQILKLSEKKFVTCSDDCVLKFWNNNKPDFDISVETITCIAKVAGDIVIAGCHSGNLLVVNTKSKAVSPIDQAHLNLVRGIVSLDYVFKGEYFISADVCGFVKVWRIVNKMPSLMQTIQMPGAISYNSVIELSHFIKNQTFVLIALKQQKLHLINIKPTYHICMFEITLEQKPSCIVQTSKKIVAVACGSLKKSAVICIYDMLAGGQLLHKLENHHSDMIDTMYYIRQNNWLISIGRDQNLIIWKLINCYLVKLMTNTPVTDEESSDSYEPPPPKIIVSEYLVKYQTSHKDFVRSMIHSQISLQSSPKMNVLLVTASEDKTIKFLTIQV